MSTTGMPQEGSSCPYTEKDVLCGRGGATNTHEGNVRFRSLVADHQREYLVAGKKEKGLMARKIVEKIQDRGGRFIAKNDITDVWEPVPEKKAIEKASQALREGLSVRNRATYAILRNKAIAERTARMSMATEKTLPNEAPKAGETSKAHPTMTTKKHKEKVMTEKNKTPMEDPTEKKEIIETKPSEMKQQALLSGVLCDVQDTVTKRSRSSSESSVDETPSVKLPKVTTWTDYENRLKSL